MSYEHIEITLNQQSKHPEMPCGDVFYSKKTDKHTTLILCDGKGHGIKANIAATMNVAYLVKLLDSDFSPRAAFFKLAEMLNKIGSDGNHYSVFAVARILSDGVTTLLTYEMPPPIFISPKGATVLDQRKIDFYERTIHETNCYLKSGEAIMLMSDGVTEAGIGRGYNFGWGSSNLCEFLNKIISENHSNKINYEEIADKVAGKVAEICKGNNDDDLSIIFANSRKGNVASVFTGPPSDKSLDMKYVQKFMKTEGKKIICGGTTSNIVAKILNKKMEVDTAVQNSFTPPNYKIEGIDLATEGAITLNQFFNIMDEERNLMDNENPVTKLHDFLMDSDKIIFYIGSFNSQDEAEIDFIQRGIKTRKQIVPIIAEKLEALGKIVVIEWI
jgi:hypothetical protein